METADVRNFFTKPEVQTIIVFGGTAAAVFGRWLIKSFRPRGPQIEGPEITKGPLRAQLYERGIVEPSKPGEPIMSTKEMIEKLKN